MAKVITNIRISNFKGYYETMEIPLPQGQNLLLYGENGSGKSSLHQAIQFFLDSSISTSPHFVKNQYKKDQEGCVSIQFKETPIEDLDNNHIELKAYDLLEKSNHQVDFVMESAPIRMFLSYHDILRLYYNKKSDDNLFDIIVLDILSDNIPAGYTENIGSRYNNLKNKLFNSTRVKTKAFARYENALLEFGTDLTMILEELFKKANSLLERYFKHLNLLMAFRYEKIRVDVGLYRRKKDWKIISKLCVDIYRDSVKLVDHNHNLNEASISACVLCLYIASILMMPQKRQLKLLSLDDIFIGIDASNRYPLLDILEHEFSDTQVLISTYDKSWFEMAKSYISARSIRNWEYFSLYVGQQNVNSSLSICKPILVKEGDYVNKAREYLYNPINPDFPAAANYFRKALENKLKLDIPQKFIKYSSELEVIEDYKLRDIISSAINICKNLSPIIDKKVYDALICIKSFLPTLLHPLSHATSNVAIYKSELIEIDTAYTILEDQLHQVPWKNIQILLENGFPIEYRPKCKSGNIYCYKIQLENHLCFARVNSDLLLSNVDCRVRKIFGRKYTGEELKQVSIKKGDFLFERLFYPSIYQAFLSINEHLRLYYSEQIDVAKEMYLHHFYTSRDVDEKSLFDLLFNVKSVT